MRSLFQLSASYGQKILPGEASSFRKNMSDFGRKGKEDTKNLQNTELVQS